MKYTQTLTIFLIWITLWPQRLLYFFGGWWPTIKMNKKIMKWILSFIETNVSDRSCQLSSFVVIVINIFNVIDYNYRINYFLLSVYWRWICLTSFRCDYLKGFELSFFDLNVISSPTLATSCTQGNWPSKNYFIFLQFSLIFLGISFQWYFSSCILWQTKNINSTQL